MIGKYITQAALICSLTLVLSSCASFYDVRVEKSPVYVKPVTIDNNFSISGRFLIKTAAKNRYGNFNWDKTGESEVLEFRTPIGQTVAQVSIESSITVLMTKDKTYRGSDLEQMMQEKLGFAFPLQYLHYWIQGVSLPNSPITSHLINGFSQLGWNVEYLQWQDKNHPRIIQCTKDDLVIKLIIDW